MVDIHANITSGRKAVTVAGTREPFIATSTPCKELWLSADTNNADIVVIGGVDVVAAGGSQIILFTTGLGTPLGSPITPVIKISSNSDTYKRMKDFIDIDAGQIINGTEVGEVGEKIFQQLIEVCNGTRTAAEINGDGEIAINRLGPTF